MFNQENRQKRQHDKLQNLEDQRNRLQQFVQAIREHSYFKNELVQHMHNQRPVREQANNQ